MGNFLINLNKEKRETEKIVKESDIEKRNQLALKYTEDIKSKKHEKKPIENSINNDLLINKLLENNPRGKFTIHRTETITVDNEEKENLLDSFTFNEEDSENLKRRNEIITEFVLKKPKEIIKNIYESVTFCWKENITKTNELRGICIEIDENNSYPIEFNDFEKEMIHFDEELNLEWNKIYYIVDIEIRRTINNTILSYIIKKVHKKYPKEDDIQDSLF